MITSKSNNLVKFIRSLKDKKNRDSSGLYIVTGIKLVKEAFYFNQNVDTVVGTQEILDGCNFIKNAKCEVVSEEVFSVLTEEASPQGILALIKKPNNKIVAPTGSCLFLDGVSDPTNVGAIIRTMACANYKDIYIADGADAFSQKAVRASMSGIFNVNIYTGTKEELLKVINIPLIIADMKGENAFYFDKCKKFCLVIGNEAHGVSQTLKEKANYTVSIPMENNMESLNAGVSAGILMYALKNSH